MGGFRKFILRGNVIDLAVAVVLGVAFAAVVNALVKGFITPLLGVFGGVPDFSSVVFTVNNSRFLVGEFINALLQFIVIAAIIYFLIILPLNKFLDRMAPKEIKTRECPECLSKIPINARRCMYCTSPVAPEVTVG